MANPWDNAVLCKRSATLTTYVVAISQPKRRNGRCWAAFCLSCRRRNGESSAGGLLGAPATYEVPRKAGNPADARQPCPGLDDVDVDVARHGPVDHHREHQSGKGAKARPGGNESIKH